MIDIVLVSPVFSNKDRPSALGHLILADLLDKAGYQVSIVPYCEVMDGFGDFHSFKKKMVDHLLSLEPRIVAFYTLCGLTHIQIELARLIKENNNEIITCLGGPDASLLAHAIMSSFSFIDFVLKGEGETTIVPFVSSLLKGEVPEGLDGLVFRKQGRIIENQNPPLISDNYKNSLDLLRFIPKEVVEKAYTISLDAGRGCPFSCRFCSTSTYWQRRYRLRDISNVVDEIEMVLQKYGPRHFFSIDHDMFTMDKKRVLAFCDELISRGLSIRFGCSARLDTVDKELLEKMKKAGLENVYFGVETGSKRMQRIINKNLDLDKAYDLLKSVSSLGIEFTFSFICGFKEETFDDLMDTMQMIMDLIDMGNNKVQFHQLSVTSGTEYYDRYLNDLVYDDQHVYTNLSGYYAAEELKQTIVDHKDVYSSFYYLPSESGKYFCYADLWRTGYYHYNLAFKQVRDSYKGTFAELFGLLIKAYDDRYLKSISPDGTSKINKYYALACLSKMLTFAELYKDMQEDEKMVVKEVCRYEIERILFAHPEIVSLFDGHSVKERSSYDIDLAAYSDDKPFKDVVSKKTSVYFSKEGKTIKTHVCE